MHLINLAFQIRVHVGILLIDQRFSLTKNPQLAFRVYSSNAETFCIIITRIWQWC